jgi:tetratricopeptide (TPR) repeat protein
MTKDRREYWSPDEREAANRVAARPRRRLVAAGLLAGAAAIGLAIAGTFPWGASRAPAEPETPEEPARSVPAPSPEGGQASLPSTSIPVPESYDGLKQEALAFGARLVERYPDASEAVGLLARMHDRFGNSAEATRRWEQWLTRHPDSAEAHFRLGRYAKEKGEDAEAVSHLQKAFELDPSLPGVQVHLGESLMNLGKSKEAVAVLEAGADATRLNPNRLLMLGHACLQTQQHEKAKAAFRKVLEIDPKYTHALFGLATACTKLGQTEEAKKHFAEFAKRKDRGIVADRADAKARLNDLPAVRQIVAVWYTTAGKVYDREGDLTEAETHWLRAAAVHPADTESRRALARLYQWQGKTHQAARVVAELRGILLRQGEANDRKGP